MKRLAILTDGGDAPGLNAVIRAAVKTAIQHYGFEILGLKDGYIWFVNTDGVFPPDLVAVRSILTIT